MSALLMLPYLARSRAIEVGTRQVEEWGLGYIDLYLIHFPIALQYNPDCTRVSSIRYSTWKVRTSADFGRSQRDGTSMARKV